MMRMKTGILATLTYFDLFNYPLTKREIWLFLNLECDSTEFNNSLSELTARAVIYQFGELYSLQNDPSIVSLRYDGNSRAQLLMMSAKKVCRLLSKFPFVRGVAVSGSLSKNVASQSSDIDLFIITTENRLWLARTFMHIFKKVTFLFNRQHFFCMNYYVDEKALEIEEKNIYTATEVVTLIPLQGELSFRSFYLANLWSKSFLPNYLLRASTAEKINFFTPKYIIEKILDNRMGNWLDGLLMKMTAGRWYKKTAENKKNDRGITMSMSATKHTAKPNPVFFQHVLLTRYTEKVRQLTKQIEPSYGRSHPYQNI
jgi:predicted nucleotidyltransferase